MIPYRLGAGWPGEIAPETTPRGRNALCGRGLSSYERMPILPKLICVALRPGFTRTHLMDAWFSRLFIAFYLIGQTNKHVYNTLSVCYSLADRGDNLYYVLLLAKLS